MILPLGDYTLLVRVPAERVMVNVWSWFGKILDASDLRALKNMDVILTCQGEIIPSSIIPC